MQLTSHYAAGFPFLTAFLTCRTCSCAGICELSKDPSTGKFTRIRLKLSTPLLQYRPRSDTVNTLLHEAIHAYFFITTSWHHSRGDDGTGHGTGFQLLADAINNHGNYEVTIYHTFHDEVDSYRTHVWQCSGPCNDRPPYFGLVKRSMNRPPGSYDFWWAKHEAECGGTYTKIQEPAITKKQLETMSKKERAGRQKNKIDSWVIVEPKPEDVSGPSDPSQGVSTAVGKRKAGTAIFDQVMERVPTTKASSMSNHKRPKNSNDDEVSHASKVLVECPICNTRVAEGLINEHLDVVHPS